MTGIIKIPLNKGFEAVVDDDFPAALARLFWWVWISNRGIPYAGTYLGRQNGTRPSALMQRLVIDAPYDREVDHINGDTLDNRRDNLRLGSRSELTGRRGLQGNNSSGFKGVHRKGDRYWIAQIKVDGRKRHVGCFPSAELAARAYDRAAQLHFGAFGFLNFPAEATVVPISPATEAA